MRHKLSLFIPSFLLFTIFLLLTSSLSYSQTKTEWIGKMNEALNNTKRKGQEDIPDPQYSLAAVFALRVAEIYEDDADKNLLDRQQINYTQAIDYYHRAARYYDEAFKSRPIKTYQDNRNKALEKAREIYKTMQEKEIDLYDNVKIDEDLLLSEEERKKKEAEDKISQPEPVESPLQGKKLLFRMPDKVFSILIPSKFNVNAMLVDGRQTLEQIYKQIDQSSGVNISGSLSRYHSHQVSNYPIGIEFQGVKKQSWMGEVKCEEPYKTDITYRSEATTIKLGSIKACYIVHWDKEYTNMAIQKEWRPAGFAQVQFDYDGDRYNLKVDARKLEPDNLTQLIEQMVKSLRLEGEEEKEELPDDKCKEGDIQLLKKGIPVSWKVLDPKRKPAIYKQATRPTDTSTPKAFSDFTGYMVRVVSGAKDVKQFYEIYQSFRRKETREALQSLDGWLLENGLEIDFLPVEIEDISDVSMDAPLTNAVLFYLSTMQKASSGLAGLGNSISNSMMRKYWIIPYSEIKGECLPRMVCGDGKWVPDPEYMQYKELDIKESSFHDANRDFQTLRQVTRELERDFYPKIGELERNMIEYADKEKRCEDAKRKLWEYDFPTQFALCPLLRSKIQSIDKETLAISNEIGIRQRELENYQSKTIPEQEADHKKDIDGVSAELEEIEGRLKKKRESLRQHTLGDNESNNKELVSRLRKEVAAIEKEKEQSSKLLDEMIKLRNEVYHTQQNNLKSMREKIRELESDKIRLNHTKSKLQQELKECEKDEAALGKK